MKLFRKILNTIFLLRPVEKAVHKKKLKVVKKSVKGLKHSNPEVKKGEFEFSQRSLDFLEEVHPKLKEICITALKTYSPYDFGIIEGLRSVERQAKLRKLGSSKVKISKHQLGLAIDFMVWKDGKHTWELEHYYPVIDAFNKAFIDAGLTGTTGVCWVKNALGRYVEFKSENCKDNYQLRGGKFFDAVHIQFEEKPKNV